MIPIDKLPSLNWTDNSAYEISEAGGDELLAQSDMAWQLGNLLIVGLIYYTLTSPPWMWFALTKDVKFRDLIDFRRIKDYIPKGTTTAVAEDFTTAQRFAEFYGFEFTGATQEYKGRSYLIYRRV
jgi:hypothetical protein